MIKLLYDYLKFVVQKLVLNYYNYMDAKKKLQIDYYGLQIKGGNINAITNLHALIGGNIRSIASRYYKNTYDIDDIVQTFWAKVPEILSKIKVFENVYGYLVKSFENIVRQDLKTNKALPIPIDYNQAFWANKNHTEYDYYIVDLKNAFTKATNKMDIREREVFYLTAYEERTVRDIAEILNIPRSTVHRLRKKSIDILTATLREDDLI